MSECTGRRAVRHMSALFFRRMPDRVALGRVGSQVVHVIERAVRLEERRHVVRLLEVHVDERHAIRHVPQEATAQVVDTNRLEAEDL
jgi:hypothetical protein